MTLAASSSGAAGVADASITPAKLSKAARRLCIIPIGNDDTGTLGAGATHFVSLNPLGNANTVETTAGVQQVLFSAAYTMVVKEMHIAKGSNNDHTFTLRDDAADTAATLTTITADVTVSVTGLTVTVAGGSALCMEITNHGGTNTDRSYWGWLVCEIIEA